MKSRGHCLFLEVWFTVQTMMERKATNMQNAIEVVSALFKNMS